MTLVTQLPHALSSLNAGVGMNSYTVAYRVGGLKASRTLQLKKGSREEASNALRKRHEVPPEVDIIILSMEPRNELVQL